MRRYMQPYLQPCNNLYQHITTILSQWLQMADKNKQLNFLKVHIVALVLAEYLAVGLLCGALVVQLFVDVGCLRAASSAVAGS